MPSRRLAVAAAVLLAAGVLLWVALRSGSTPLPPMPAPTPVAIPGGEGMFAYVPGRDARYSALAVVGSEHVLFEKSPGGILTTAARVQSLRGLIAAAAARTAVDPATLEAIVFLESAGRPDAIAGIDPSAAAGLTQILPQTGASLLGMQIDLAASRKLTAKIDTAAFLGRRARVIALERARERVDQRFDPARALAATVRYLELAEQHLRRLDLAVVSYHMGIGNLEHVLDAYDGGAPVPYAQLFFDSTPVRHAGAYQLLSSLGDDASLYWWRILGAEQIMSLYRSDPGALRRLTALQTALDSGAEVLHPPSQTPGYPDPQALQRAYGAHQLELLPSDPARAGLRYSSAIGSLAGAGRQAGAVPRAAARGLGAAAVARRPGAGAVARHESADRLERGAGPALSAAAGRKRSTGGGGVVVHDRAQLRQPRPGARLPGGTRSPAGARRDRLGALSGGDRGDRRLRCPGTAGSRPVARIDSPPGGIHELRRSR